MSDRLEILGALQDETAAVRLGQLAEKLGVKPSQISSQVKRCVADGVISKTEEGEYLLTPEGQAELARAQKPKITEEEALVTDYQVFMQKGKVIGIPDNVVSMTAEHVWNGGNYQDLNWVWEAFGQMNIRPDLKNRWWHSWRTYLHQGIPPELKEKVAAEEKAEVKPGAGPRVEEGRSYILQDDLPVYVGKNLGDLTYEDALDLARIRGGRAARQPAQGAPSQPLSAHDIIEIVNAVRDWTGASAAAPKSYMVTQGEEGAIVREVEPGKPVVLEQAAKQPGSTYMVNPDGEVKELKPGEPIVIKQPASTPTKTFIVKQTPEGATVVEEHDLSKPIIINAPLPSSNMPPMYPFPVMSSDGKPVLDEKGNPVYANIEPMLKWMGFQNEERRADDRHKGLMELVQLAKENIPVGMQALSRAAAEQGQGSSEAETGQQQQAYQCGSCKTKFTLPKGPWEFVACPSCGTQYSHNDVFGSQEGA